MGALRLLPLVLLFIVAGCASSSSVAPTPRGASAESRSDTPPDVTVGITHLTLDGPAHDATARAVEAELYYPAHASARAAPETHTFIYTLDVARDAAYGKLPRRLNGNQRPLVVLSHGSGGTPYDLAWLARALVKDGYLAVALRHPGNTYGDNDDITALHPWERARDARAALSALLAHPLWGPRVDADRIVAAGHSVGGFTVLQLAGLRYSIEAAESDCFRTIGEPICDYVRTIDRSPVDYTRSNESYRDPRIKAVVALAPAVGEAMDPATVDEVDARVLIVGPRQDDLVTFWFHSLRFANAIEGADLRVLEEGTHYSFITPCNAFGRTFIGDPCVDRERGPRDALQARVNADVLAFFEQVLTPPQEAERHLQAQAPAAPDPPADR